MLMPRHQGFHCVCCPLRRGYQSGAQFDRTSRVDDQLPITARPLAAIGAGAGAAGAADAGATGAAEGGLRTTGTAAGLAGGGVDAATSHDSDVLEELK